MTIIIGTDPLKALGKIDLLERDIKQKLGKSIKSLDLSRLKKIITEANEASIVKISEDVVISSPAWSRYLASNWEAISGNKPRVKPIASPSRWPGKFAGAVDKFWINGFIFNGEQPIHIYNDADYGNRVAMGNFLAKSAPSDWYLSIQQYHASGSYYLNALAEARRRYTS